MTDPAVLSATVTAFVALATFVVGQAVAARLRVRRAPLEERDMALTGAKSAFSIFADAMGQIADLRSRITELENEVERLKAENAEMRRQLNDYANGHPPGASGP